MPKKRTPDQVVHEILQNCSVVFDPNSERHFVKCNGRDPVKILKQYADEIRAETAL